MLVFLKKVFLFLIPVSLIFVFPLMVIVFGREYVSARDVVQTQMDYPDTLFGFAYNDESFIPYKKLLVEVKKPTVVALGTSRVMQIRKEFFKDPKTFVNAGGAGKTLGDVEQFIQELPADNNVKVLILGLDQDMFYKTSVSPDKRAESLLPLRYSDILATMSRRIYLDYATHKYSISVLLDKSRTTNNIGLSALMYEDGFRSDGSYRYNQASNNIDRVKTIALQIEQKANDIKKDRREPDDFQKQQLELNLTLLFDILDRCKQKGIVVVGFMPPYPQLEYQAMVDAGGLNNEMITVIPKKVTDIFAAHNNFFSDLSSPTIFGGNETEFVDVIHGTDIMYVKLILYLSERTKDLSVYTDTQFLKETVRDVHQDFLPL